MISAVVTAVPATLTVDVPVARQPLDWLAIIALMATVGLALAGFRQDRQRTRDAMLVRLQDTFTERDWRMRYWRLDLATRRAFIESQNIDEGRALHPDDIRLSPFTPENRDTVITPWVDAMRLAGQVHFSGRLSQALLDGFCESVDDEMLRDFLGPPCSDSRCDFADFWTFCMQLHYWLTEPDAPLWATRGTRRRKLRKNAAAMTAMFGSALLITMNAHREAVLRLAKPLPGDLVELSAAVTYSRPYYWKHYGLTDQRYSVLVDALVEAAHDMQLLSETQRERIAWTEQKLARTQYRADHGRHRDNVESVPHALRSVPAFPKGW